ncbi:MAG: serine/threonine-protein kinase [bacterium]
MTKDEFTMASSQTALTLTDVLKDLRTIVQTIQSQEVAGKASYEAVQKHLTSLRLHALTYIRFLENHGYVEYDRVGDHISTTELAVEAGLDDSLWSAQVADAFGEQLNGSSDDGPDFGAEVDSLFDNFEVGAAEFAPAADDAQTGPEHQTPAISPEPELPTPKTKMNQQDSFRERRLATGSNPTASRQASAPETSLYEREDEIGSGGMGTVYKGRQVKLNRTVAIKEVKEIFDVFAGVQRADIVAKFTKIVQTQSALIHPNIIQTIDIDTDARFPFVVLQYAPNGNLRRLIDTSGRPSLQVALKYFLQILHALSAAHDSGVTHGGIKPENVVLDASGNALMTDFGISQVVELDSSRANQVYVGVGTVAYMSPEQFRDPNASSIKSDVYSLGIMFYEMLTGKVPGRRSPMPSSFYPDIPRKLDDIFDRMCMDDKDDRYGGIDEILAELYSSKEVLKILDKRGGFLFLRDPMQHGETGLKVEIPMVEEDDEPGSLGEQSSSLGEDSSDVEDSEADDDDEASDETPGEGDGDVLNKLDKYGKLFEDDAPESDD